MKIVAKGPSQALLAALAVLVCAVSPARSAEPGLGALIAQIEGRDCRYSADVHAPCARNSMASRWLRWIDPTSRYRCTLGAARCLEQMGTAARPAVPALIRALAHGPNDYDTGDGSIAARSGIASALGAIGDPAAIDPLAEALAHASPPDRGAGALITKEPAARHAIVQALGGFGRAAGHHWQRVAGLLRERNADAAYLPRQRELFEQSQATDIAADEHRRQNPDETSFTISPESIEAARLRLDPASSQYRRSFEVKARDHLASACAITLGRFARAEAAPLLVETLRNPAASEAAAKALAELRVHSDAVTAGLQDAVTSMAMGPASRRAAAEALGRVGDEGSAVVLARALSDPEVCEGAAKGLDALGPSAIGALPALAAVLRKPIQTERTGRAVKYDIEATRRLAEKAAAVRAIERIGGRRAQAALEPFTADPDIGSNVRRALKRMVAGATR